MSAASATGLDAVAITDAIGLTEGQSASSLSSATEAAPGDRGGLSCVSSRVWDTAEGLCGTVICRRCFLRGRVRSEVHSNSVVPD